LEEKIRIGFLPFGNINRSDVREDLDEALKSLRSLNLVVIERPATTNPGEIIKFSEELQREDICILILVPLHGMQSVNVVLAAERSRFPVLIWALPTRYSFPTSASAIGNLRERELNAKLVYGSPDGKEILNQILIASKAAYAIKKLREARIGRIGVLQYSNVASHCDVYILRDRLGPEIVQIPVNELMETFNKITYEETEEKLKETLKKFGRIEIDEADLKKPIKLHLAIKRLIEKYDLSGIVLECYTELGIIFGTNPCFGFAENLIIGCEGDILQAVTSLLVKNLTGKDAYQADLFSADLDNNLLKIVHCSAPAGLAKDPSKVTLSGHKPPMELGRYTMAVCKPQIQHGLVTLLRLFGKNLDKIHLITGELLSYDFGAALEVSIKVTENLKKFVENVSGNHYLLVPGDIRGDLRELCYWLKIQLIET